MQENNLQEFKEQLRRLKALAEIADRMANVLVQQIDITIETCMDMEDNNAI